MIFWRKKFVVGLILLKSYGHCKTGDELRACISCLVFQINGLIQNYFWSICSVQDTILGMGEKDEMRALCLHGARSLMWKANSSTEIHHRNH